MNFLLLYPFFFNEKKTIYLSFLSLLFLTFSMNSLAALSDSEKISAHIGTPTDQDVYTFYAEAGDNILARIADIGANAFYPRISLYSSSGTRISHAAHHTATGINYTITTTGEYSFIISDYYQSNAGAYHFYFNRIAGANEHGLLANDSVNSGQIDLGDLDSYTFIADVGDNILLRVADIAGASLYPRMTLYAPDGSQISHASHHTATGLNHTAEMSGTYTVVISDYYVTGTGIYELFYARIAGANEHGLLVNDSVNSGELTLGDLDTYTLSASTGDNILLRIADINGASLYPRITLYAPDGSQISQAAHHTATGLNHTATVDGTYTVVISDYYVTGTGEYQLFYTHMVGANEHGLLTNDSVNNGEIELGDLDSYTLVANTGDNILLRIADINGASLYPRITLYAPDGSQISQASHHTATGLNHTATVDGTYTVVISDYYVTGTGEYQLFYTHVAGANEHGLLVNDSVNSGELTLGDMDSYTLVASAGDNILVRIADFSGASLYPRITLYAPDGSQISQAAHHTATGLNHTATVDGTYTIIISDYYVTGTGSYHLYYTKVTGADEYGLLSNDSVSLGDLALGDLDSYTFTATAGDYTFLRLVDIDGTSFYPRLYLYGPDGTQLISSSHHTATGFNHRATTSGTYTVVVSDYYITGTGNYHLYFSKAPGANELGTLYYGDEKQETIDLGDLDSFTFDPQLNHTIKLSVTDTSGNSFYPEITLVAPNGDLLKRSSHHTQASIIYTIPYRGVYTVLVSDRYISGIGNYKLTYSKISD
ncbi:hypothetical protein [Aliikangiella sp. IMCC44359]|uniref:hypothetical protein n=1 Tax=Aliikangiella sp. IMCC44359 TaxID=3459125 RepID=UPI00403ABBAF